MEKQKKWFANSYLLLVFAILYAPIIFLAIYSFNSGGSMVGFEEFTFEWYQELFTDTRLFIILLNTLVVALLSATIATIVGIAGALAIHTIESTKYKSMLLTLNNILIVSPDVIIGASFLILFTVMGISLGFFSVLLSHIAFSIPIVVIMILPKLKEMSPSLIDAAQDLGASRWQVISRVILPYITSGIFAGFFTALTFSLDDFAVTFFVTGNGFNTLAVEVYSLARQGISLKINALSTIIFMITLILVLGYYFLSTRKKPVMIGGDE
ncbi:MAG: ABC transporter permease [Culicoidibacterales bacterium]